MIKEVDAFRKSSPYKGIRLFRCHAGNTHGSDADR
jgi:hypothetical protein